MRFNTIIFDMDGTIVETNHCWQYANKTILERRGITFTPDIQEYLSIHLSGLSLRSSCVILKDLTKSDEPIDHIMQEKSTLAASIYDQGIKLIPGFETFHEKITASNIKSGLATNADDNTFIISKKMSNVFLVLIFITFPMSISSVSPILLFTYTLPKKLAPILNIVSLLKTQLTALKLLKVPVCFA